MTVAPSTPPLGVSAASAGEPDPYLSLAPDARELFGIAAAGVAVLCCAVFGVGEVALAQWLPESLTSLTPQSAIAVVVARFFPWLVGLLVLSGPFALRWTPRVHQRLLEPSLVASWATLFVAVAVALLLGRSGIFPWRWASTTPEVATLLTTLVVSDQVAAVALYVVLACVLVPLLTELFFRYGAIEWLRSRGLSAPTAVAVAAVAYGATFLSGLSANSDAALRHAGFGVLFGLVLGLLAVKGRRGRGLGLAIIAHGAFVAVELAVLLGVRVTP